MKPFRDFRRIAETGKRSHKPSFLAVPVPCTRIENFSKHLSRFSLKWHLTYARLNICDIFPFLAPSAAEGARDHKEVQKHEQV